MQIQQSRIINRENEKVVIFDLYGTLVDWRSTINSFISFYAGNEYTEKFFECDYREVVSYKPYSQILAKCLGEVFREAGILYSQELVESFILMFTRSPLFPDTIYALKTLQKHGFKTAILSNTERKLVDITLYGFRELFNYVITAEDVKAYKPSLDAFINAYRTIGVEPDNVIHVSAYPQYDLIPASKLGAKTILVDRRLGYSWPLKVNSLVELPTYLIDL